ncbi:MULTISPECIES: elongation factor P 5-aminopentanone reductase [Clostridium]|uniref:3-oxoacyl-[acyl-carrier-protein] reductase FabG n=2 Tax=Clostridium TaxID=1485 RepID=D8GP92_CLOLD|nr:MULTISPECIES: SDR family oxidoreductase [Clostridium]ADK15970.1 predicted short-chain dehydrogenase [Clostridium ljungdahlii DSM 13528]AGY75141.1 SDR family oxidoreductase [Clostridium autoethanogenum DSM 10061]ALU35312.1 Short-chain dehydrogenase/reductase SDR [Clostridium autoethanogenum DSM 10061]OAA87156.1 3-oxoacyl-[acyl-carrier-protein] reductase FabG [Clostridium ljungdahlii DSM 13528]OVY49609.1 3-oxoacyl-[acyl-carrier-protein] reductase FabG [Clostridium autoethanogenum]
MENLGGKVAIVTGASRGIGRSIAINLAKCGANVVINYKKDEKEAYKTLDMIKQAGSVGMVVQGDVSLYSNAERIVQYALSKMGKIDILVNNAGISKIGLFVDMKEDEWNSIIDVNLKGVLNCSHSVLKHMISKKSGSIINISSMWGNVGAACESIYSASKGAINLFTKSIAKEMAPSNIRVNAVAPGVIDTEMNSWLKEDEKKSLIEDIPMGKFGQCKDIAKTVCFLAGDSSAYITGQIITVDGGMI